MSNDPTSDKALNLYTQQMEQIKLRINAMELVFSKKCHTPYQATDIEFCALQLRKVIEGILFSSLVTNSDKYLQAYNKLATAWNAQYIMNDLFRINPKFYPEPIKIVHHPERIQVYADGTRNTGDDFVPIEEYITPDKIIKVHEKLGGIMHERNPFSVPIDYPLYEKLIHDTTIDVKHLLNTHLAHMADNEHIYFVGMQEADTGNVHVALFERQAAANSNT